MGKWIPLTLPLVLLALYFSTLPYGYVFDTTPNVENAGVDSVGDALGRLVASGRPVVDATLMLNHAVDGENPVGYRLFNVLVHAVTAMLLYALVRRTLLLPRFAKRFADSAPWIALAVAGLWMLHPLTTSAVTYVIQRYESVMALFYVLTLYAVLRAGTSARAGGWVALAIAACALGMGSKQVMASTPIAALLFDRAFVSGSFAGALRRRWGLYLGLACTWGVLIWVSGRDLVGASGSAGFGFEPLSPMRYFLSQGEVILHYLRLCFYPYPLVLDYGWIPAFPERPDLWVPGFVVVGLLAAASLWGLIRNAWWGWLGAVFFLVLGPTSSFVPIADLAFEHRMYLPLAAVVAGVVVVLWGLLQRFTTGRTPVVLGAVLAVAAALSYAVMTYDQNLLHASRVAVWSHVIEHRPYNARGWNNLASAYFDLEYYDEAEAGWRRVLELRPNHARSYDGLASVLLRRGQLDRAMAYFDRAVELQPDEAEYRYNRGEALLMLGRIDDARRDYEAAIERRPDYAKAYNNLGLIEVRQGRMDDALADFREAITLDPELADAYQNLALTLRRVGDVRGAVLAYRDALALEPDNPVLLTQLARLLATTPAPELRDADQALRLAQRANELTGGRDVVTLDTLAAALANAGRFDEAAAVSQQARQRAGEQGAPPAAIAEIDARTRLYESHRPYREAPSP